jgi:hypothetical protein
MRKIEAGLLRALTAAVGMAVVMGTIPAAASGPAAAAPKASVAVDSTSNSGYAEPASAVVLAVPKQDLGPCLLGEVTANPTRPAWDYAASTTQCGVAEADSGWELQPMSGGIRQQMMVSSVRYGLTPRLDLRWGLTDHITQAGAGTTPIEGAGDQWLSARYRFYEQGRRMPAMALLYAAKIPSANPAKGFGSGFVDHQLILIASRDLGKYHFDFNTVGTLAGGADGYLGAAQFGLAMTRPVNAKLSVTLESYGGPQPGTPDRFGAAFGGATYALRPGLVFDAAYTRTYTAGSPRAQVLTGMTYALRPGFAQLPRNGFVGRLLGR